MKKIVLFLMIVAIVFGLAACNREIDDTLDSPQNVQITEGIVSWSAVEDADHYIVYVNEDDNDVLTTSFDLNTLDLAEGTYAITVVAVRDDKVSLPSSALSYIVEGEVVDTVLPPENLSLTGDILSWTAVDGATGYRVHVGSMTFNVVSTTLDLSTRSIPVGTHTVYVIALKNTLTSNPSSNVSYTVEENVVQEDVKLTVLKMMNPSYEVDLTNDDFEDYYDYLDYLMALDSADAYASASVELGMTSAQAISFFSDAKDMFEGMDSIFSMTQFTQEMEIFDDYNMDAEDLAVVAYSLVEVMVQQEIRYYHFNVDEQDAIILDYQDMIDDLRSSDLYVDFYDLMMSFATVDEEDAIDAFFSGQYYTLFYSIYEIRNSLIYNQDPITSDDYAWVEDFDPTYIDDLMNVMTKMMQDVEGEAFIATPDAELQVLQFIHMYLNNIEEQQENKLRNENEILMLEEIKLNMSQNKAEVLGSLEVFFDFILTVNDTLPQNLIDLVDDMMMGEDLTMTEMFIIKDELVLVLQNALPSAADFALVYETLLVVVADANDMDVQAYLEYTELMGLVNYAALDLMFTLLGDVDEALVLGGMMILEDAEDEYGNIDIENNPEVAIDFALYVINYLETFVDENQVKVDALTNLFTYQMKEDFYVMILDAIIYEVENDMYMDPNEKLMLIDLLEELQLEFDTYYQLYSLFEDAAFDVLRYVIDTEARILKTMISISEEVEPDLAILLPSVELLIEDMRMIHFEMFGDMTETELDILFEAAKIPLRAMINAEMPELDFDALYVAVTPDIKTVLLNFISLQVDLMVQFDALDLDGIILNENLTSEQLGIAYALVTAIDLTITVDNEAMIFSSMDLVFDSVLSNETVLTLIGATQAEVDEMQTNMTSLVNDIIDEIQYLAMLDIDNLSIDDEQRLYDFMAMLGFYQQEMT